MEGKNIHLAFEANKQFKLVLYIWKQNNRSVPLDFPFTYDFSKIAVPCTSNYLFYQTKRKHLDYTQELRILDFVIVGRIFLRTFLRKVRRSPFFFLIGIFFTVRDCLLLLLSTDLVVHLGSQLHDIKVQVGQHSW